MERMYITAIFLLLALVLVVDAAAQAADYQGLRTAIIMGESSEDIHRHMAAGLSKKEMKEELERQNEAFKEDGERKIKVLEDEIKGLEMYYKEREKSIKQKLQDLIKKQDMAEDSSEVTAENTGAAKKDVCKKNWFKSSGNNVNCVGGKFCYDADSVTSGRCILDCNEPACDPDDTKCCGVCPCCEGCYSGSTPDKCLSEELVKCVCDPFDCCATFSCDASLSKEKAKLKFKQDQEELKTTEESEIDHKEQTIKQIKEEIKQKEKQIKEQIKQLGEGP